MAPCLQRFAKTLQALTAHLDLPSPEAYRNISVISRPADGINNQRIFLIPTMESRQLSV